MNKEDKELLLKDLCGRLPYGVKVQHIVYGFVGTVKSIYYGLEGIEFESEDKHYDIPIEEIIPYLQPMNSMTYEERDKFMKLGGVMSHNIDATDFIKDGMVDNVEIGVPASGPHSGETCSIITFNTDAGKESIEIPIDDIFDVENDTLALCTFSTEAYDWLNANYFDYRGLIEKGLAIAVTEENNPYDIELY